MSLLFVSLTLLFLLLYFNYHLKKIKRSNQEKLKILYNQIAKEQIINEHYKKELAKVYLQEKNINQKLVTLRTDILAVNFTLNEIFKYLLANK